MQMSLSKVVVLSKYVCLFSSLLYYIVKWLCPIYASLTIYHHLNIKGRGKVVVFLGKLRYKNGIEHRLLFITLNISNLCVGKVSAV